MIRTEMKPEISPSALVMYQEFAREFGDSGKVIYPCSGIDVTPSQVFKDVTYVEKDEERARLLRRDNYNIFNLDILALKSSGYDLLIIQNPSIPTEWMTPHLFPEGLIIANNYHGNAKWLYERSGKNKEFDFIAGLEIKRLEGNNFKAKLVKEASEYFTPIKDEKEFHTLPEERKRTILRDIATTLSVLGKESPSGNFIQDLRRAQQFFKKDFSMPARRIAESYIFRKN